LGEARSRISVWGWGGIKIILAKFPILIHKGIETFKQKALAGFLFFKITKQKRGCVYFD
jgi:hypothetical protein